MLWADPCCHGNEIWARRGDPVAYRLVLLILLVKLFVAFCSFVYRWIKFCRLCVYNLVVENAMSDVAGVKILKADTGQQGEDIGLPITWTGM